MEITHESREVERILREQKKKGMITSPQQMIMLGEP